jgi:polyphosphate kinase
VRWDDLDDAERRAGTLFDERIFPVLTPLAVDPAHPFPYISGLSLNLAVVLRNPDRAEHFARVKVPAGAAPVRRRLGQAAGSCRSRTSSPPPRPAVHRHGGALEHWTPSG